MTDSSGGAGAGATAGQWKSRFPVARIKKIMQADEDVGKVAQVTPVAISKALELFMDRIIKAVADETKSRGAKRVTPSHFKQIISTQKQYDFLESLTADIALPPSRPSTPPSQASGTQPRRRRRQSPIATPTVDPPADAPKRKRRSPQKDASQTEENSIQTGSPVKCDPDIKSEQGDNTTEDKHRRGWFDIVMGSNNEESSEDEGAKKRKRTAKDEDEDYVP